MNPITTVMRQCRLFDGIPEEKYQNVLACLRGETKLFRKDAILLQIGECQKRPGVVMDGTLRISLYSEDGNLVTIERLGRGQGIWGDSGVLHGGGQSHPDRRADRCAGALSGF